MSLESAIAEITKALGEGAIRRMSEMPSMDVKVIDTGSLTINAALGRGGWPRGHIVELWGKNGAGKTTLCYHAIANAQKAGLEAAFIDVEHRVDLKYAQAIGVDVDRLLFSQPASGEEACDIGKILLQNKAVSLLVYDSIAALTPKVFIDGDFDDANIGKHAKLMSNALRQFSQLKTHADCCILMTNQIRENPGAMFSNPEYQPGGQSPKFYSSVRCSLKSKTEKDDEGKEAYNTCTLKVVKNSLAQPFKEAEFTIGYGTGIDQTRDTFNAAVNCGIIQKKGSWYQIRNTQGEWKNFAQGEEKSINWFREKEKTERLRQAVLGQQEKK